MPSLNKVMIIGNLGRDPVLRRTEGGEAVTKLLLATTRFHKDVEGITKAQTDWHDVVVFGAQAERCSEHLVKGKKIYVEGRLQTRSWEKQGVKRYSTEVVASQVHFLGGGNRLQGTAPAPLLAQAPAEAH